MWFRAFWDLLRRYWQVTAAVWAVRKQLVSPARHADELAFLPAALEVQETPPHPAARATLYVLMSLLLLALLWAIFGKVDIVAVAPGKLIVPDQSKVIQSMQTGVVRAIHVRDGQLVRAGQLLIELDGTIAQADTNKSRSAWLQAHLDQLKAKALLQALEQGQTPVLSSAAEDLLRYGDQATVAELRQSKMHEMQASWLELQARLASIESDTQRRQMALASAQDQLHKLEQTLPIARQREADVERLVEQNFLSRHALLEKQQVRIELEQNLASQRNQVREQQAGIQSNSVQARAVRAEFQRQQHDALARAAETLAQQTQDVVKAEQQQALLQLRAPVDGVVQQLAVHTVGGVVSPAQALLVVVPAHQTLEAEVVLANKDVGFVNAGQAAAVKVETFNFTKYGLIDGKVRHVSLDAIEDEKLGLVYQARISLARSTMNIDGKLLQLAPGMAVNVEMKTGERRLIEFFLSPLLQHTRESARER